MKVRKVFAVLCSVIILCNSGMGLVAHAEEIVSAWKVSEYKEPAGDNVAHGIYDIPDMNNAKAAMLSGCSIGISVNENGVYGSIKTGSTVIASEIGIENIRVEKYVDGTWKLVGTHPGGYETNDDACVMYVKTNSAQEGVEYRIGCTHYAILEGKRHEIKNMTSGVSYHKK